jgi:hypothetical protein
MRLRKAEGVGSPFELVRGHARGVESDAGSLGREVHARIVDALAIAQLLLDPDQSGRRGRRYALAQTRLLGGAIARSVSRSNTEARGVPSQRGDVRDDFAEVREVEGLCQPRQSEVVGSLRLRGVERPAHEHEAMGELGMTTSELGVQLWS